MLEKTGCQGEEKDKGVAGRKLRAGKVFTGFLRWERQNQLQMLIGRSQQKMWEIYEKARKIVKFLKKAGWHGTQTWHGKRPLFSRDGKQMV